MVVPAAPPKMIRTDGLSMTGYTVHQSEHRLLAYFADVVRVRDEDGREVLGPFGTPLTELVPGGRVYSWTIDAGEEDGLTLLRQIVGDITADLAGAVMAEMGVSFTPEDLEAAVRSLANRGVSAASIISARLEKIEAARMDDHVRVSSVMGPVPMSNDG